MAHTLTLREAAEELGVHYMTAYRYVRTGRLAATKEGAEWRVKRSDLKALDSADNPPARKRNVDWEGRLYDRLVAGDEAGSWKVVESAMASAHEPTDIYIEMLAPALRHIGQQWHAGKLDIAVEHQASAIASRIVGRVGALMRPRGRRRGTIVIGGPAGERHSLSIAITADIMRASGYDVVDVGADVPDDSFALAVSNAQRLRAVAIGVSTTASIKAAKRLISRLRRQLPDGVPVIVGGPAVADADAVGADYLAANGADAVDYLTDGR